MPQQRARQQARRAARQGKKPTTQAGAFVREEMRRYRRGSRRVRSRRQAIAIGLSEARRAGVKVGAPKKGRGRRKPALPHARGKRKAARTRTRRAAP